MARRTCRRRSSCATVTPPRTGRRVGRRSSRSPRRPDGGSRALALARTECQISIRRDGGPVAEATRAGGAVLGRRPIGWAAVQRPHRAAQSGGRALIFKAVRNGRPYPDHGLSARDWAMIPPRQIRLDTLTTTRRELALDTLLAEDSTFYGDLFPHAVQWRGELYLEDGLHRALRAALQQRNVIHVRVLDLDALIPAIQG